MKSSTNLSLNMGFKVWLNWIGIVGILFSISGCSAIGGKSTMGLIQNASKSLAKQLASNLTTDQKLRVGILPLDEKSGSTIEIADALQESLKTRLFLTKRFDVIEDDDMKKVLQELKVQEQGEGILKQETIQHVGEQLGADAIVVGKITVTEHDTMFNFYNDYLIDYRLVPIKSGVVGSAGETMISTSRF